MQIPATRGQLGYLSRGRKPGRIEMGGTDQRPRPFLTTSSKGHQLAWPLLIPNLALTVSSPLSQRHFLLCFLRVPRSHLEVVQDRFQHSGLISYPLPTPNRLMSDAQFRCVLLKWKCSLELPTGVLESRLVQHAFLRRPELCSLAMLFAGGSSVKGQCLRLSPGQLRLISLDASTSHV